MQPWEQFIREDDERLKQEKKRDRDTRILFTNADKDYATEDAPQTRESKAQMYDDFSALPAESQEQIISDITSKRDSGEPPKELVARVANIIKAHADFEALGESGRGQPTTGREQPLDENKQWRKELDEIIENMEQIKSHGPKNKKIGGEENKKQTLIQ